MENKKPIELNDQNLEKVTGGFSEFSFSTVESKSTAPHLFPACPHCGATGDDLHSGEYEYYDWLLRERIFSRGTYCKKCGKEWFLNKNNEIQNTREGYTGPIPENLR